MAAILVPVCSEFAAVAGTMSGDEMAAECPRLAIAVVIVLIAELPNTVLGTVTVSANTESNAIAAKLKNSKTTISCTQCYGTLVIIGSILELACLESANAKLIH